MRKTYIASLIAIILIVSNSAFAQEVVHPTKVTTGHFLGKSIPLRDIKPIKKDDTKVNKEISSNERNEEDFELNESMRAIREYPYKSTAQPQGPDPVWQNAMPNNRAGTRAPILNFQGQSSPYNPSDCNGSVGANHFMQGVNSDYEIYDKNTGNVVVSSTAFNTLFSGVTGANYNDGDIIVLYDDNADRWFASEFSISGSNDYMLIAVSETNDPTGSWYRWSFDVDDMPDYMKFGIWEDGYYMADNNSGNNDIYVFERSVMLTGGASPQMIAFSNPNRPNSGFHCIQPLDNDGQWAPTGTPGQFITINDDAWGGGGDELWVFECNVDWNTTSNSTFSRTQTITVPAFDSDFGANWDNIAQPGTTQELDAIPQILMYRAQYRNFGTTQTIVCAHTVDVDNTDHAGVRWYELQNSGSGWSIRQSGTYAPDGDSRWIPSIAMDGQHNISLAYSISSTSTYPGIRYCAQSAAENANASGIMDIAEEVILNGTSSQTSSNRWGDYAELSVDPVDDVTFWFTTQYSNSGVKTQIANWRFGNPHLPPGTNFVINTPNTLIRPVPLLEGDDATYTNLTTGTVDTWAWDIEGGNPSTSSQQDPGTINYPTAGLYYTELTATNVDGDSTLRRTDYIRVIDPNNVFCDTILQFYGTPSIYTSSGGYVGGTNEYDCNAIAEKFENFSPYNKITGGRFFWAKATNGTSPNITFAVWADDGSGNPGTQLATKTLALADIVNDAATLGYTDMAFDADVILPATGAFFIGFEMPGDAASGDTLAIVTNNDGNGNDNTGYSLYSAWTDYSAWNMTLMNAIFTYGCYDPDLAPIADFIGNPTTVNAGSTVDFTDLSYGGTPTSWSWSFAGGTPNTSTQQNPTITYNTPGYYDVTLTVSNANGTDTETKTSYIHVVDANSCSCTDLGNVVGSEVLYSTGGPGYVSGNNEYGDLAKAEYFDNYAPYTNLEGAYISFGMAYVNNPSTNITINVYADDGGNSGNNAYTYSPGTILATTTVNINDIKTDIDNGDSTYVSFGSLTIPGNFYIGFIIPNPTGGGDSLAVRTGQQGAGTDKGWEQWDNNNWYSYNEAGWGDSFNNAIYPVVCSTGAPMPDFEANNTIIAAGGVVDFADLTTCSPTSWDWNFQGGTPATSTNQSPSITYNTAGTYDVTLTATNADGSNSEQKTAYITVLEPIVWWDFPNDPDNDLSDGGIPANDGTKSITTVGGAGAPSFGAAGASTNAAIARTWGTGADTKAWQVDFTTTGYGSLMLYSKQNGDARSPKDWKVQYSLDGTSWTDLPGATITCATDWTTGVLNGVSLPASLENQPDVYLRWIMTTNDGIGGSIFDTRDNLIDDIMVVGVAIGTPPVADFTADNTSICEGATVTFTDNSTNTPTSWAWDFGDGNTSTQQNPSYVYAAAGTYTVVLTATNAAGSDTQTKTDYITVNANPTVSTSVTDVNCYNGNDGSATATGANGQTPYGYSWNTGASTATISGLSSGTYTVTVTDANTCTSTTTATVSQPASALSANITATTNVNCYGGSDGSATVSATGGTSPYTYEWPSTNTGATENNLSAGTYIVTVTDANSCTTTATATISQPTTALSTSITGTNINCNGGNDGSATVSATGGTSPYSYNWSNGGSTATISGLTAGTYNVTVTDANNCTSTESINISEPATALSTSITGTDVNCNGGNDGTASVTASGGTSPYTYSWSTGANTDNITGLSQGTYTVTITDANSCSNTESITINEPVNGLSTSISGNDINCNGANDGNATVAATGGTSPYSYSWSTGASTDNITGLSQGTYTVTVSDANSCTSTESIVINEPTALSTSISGTNIDCNGNSTGSASVTASGGTSPYSYSWNTGASTNTINNLTAGTYTVTVTDANNCTSSESINITEPNALTLSIAGTDASCNGSSDGSATANVSGGTTAYNYAWSSGGNGATESGLSAGTYNLTVTDANSCTISDNITINEPSAIVISETHNDATCGNSDGSITASATGGAGSYTYSWSNGDNGATISGLNAGTYTVTVSDANGCTNNLAISISNVGGPSLTMSSTDATCNGGNDGTASVTATGGTTPYSYLWSTGGTNDNISGLTANSYSVTVTDGNSCSATGNVTVSEPSAITVVETITDVGCNGGTDGEISLAVSGGTSPYNFVWGPYPGTSNPLTGLQAGSYNVTITDNNVCSQTFGSYVVNEPTAISVTQTVTDATCYGGNDGSVTLNVTGGTSPYTYAWSSGGNGATETGLSAGSYTVTVTDNHNCSTIENVTVGEGAEIVLTMNSTDASCGSSNGTADVSVTGGTSPYTYLWNTSEITDAISGLVAGTYSVTVTDNNSCTANSNVTINNIGGPTLTMNTTDVSCYGGNDGSANVIATGGTTPYTYAWSSGGNTDTETGLSAGSYTVTVTDASTCSSTSVANINEPTELTVAETISDATCAGCTDGSITLIISGGTTPYSYSWSDGSSNQDLTNVGAGSYTVTVTDANGCQAIETYNINEPNSMTITIVSTNDVSCYGLCDGSTTISVAGGTSPYTYDWPSGNAGTTENGLCAGIWTVTVTDASGTSEMQDITINEPTEISNTFTINDANCGVADGSVSTSVNGGTSPYNYVWSTGSTNDNISSVNAGTYYLTVTDANSCQKVDSANVGNIGGPTLSITSTNVSCYGLSDGSATVVANGGSSPYTYAWSSGGNTDNETGLSASTYTVTVTDATSCISTESVVITEPTEITAIENIIDVSCAGSNDGSISISVSGGSSPYNYNWSSGGTNDTETGLAGGIYTVTVTDNNGCTFEGTYTINEGNALNMSVVSTSDVSCNGGNNGSAIVNLDGGTAPVTYTWDNSSVGNTIYNLEVGTYNVTAVDANGCTANTSITINEPTAMQIDVNTVDAHCGNSDGSATVVANGGTSPYNYLWSDGSTDDNLTNLAMGIYIVTVTDANGCQQVITNVINNTDAPIITLVGSNIYCNGDSTGTITTNVTGGTQPYNYLWSNGSTDDNIYNLTADDYFVSVSDANNCTAIAQHSITQPDTKLKINHDITLASCKEMNDGAIQLDIEYGTEPYIFNWSTGETTDYLDEIKIGNYIITVTDANNCETVDSIAVTSVKESCLHVYNTLTPNGDGKNDTWIIDGIENFSNVDVKVFNQWGNLVWQHSGYYENWDGTKNGKLLPAATYYYVLDLGNGSDVLKGDLTIISSDIRIPIKPKKKKVIYKKGVVSNNNSKNL